MLCALIAGQAEEYYFSHVLELKGVADHEPVTAHRAIDKTIKSMFDSEYFGKKQKARLHRRLFIELTQNPDLCAYMANYQVSREVYDHLEKLVTSRISARAGKPYEELQAEREELARELTVHPDLSPLVVA
jgi:hypothetical protein